MIAGSGSVIADVIQLEWNHVMKRPALSIATLMLLVTIAFTIIVAVSQYQLRAEVNQLRENASNAFEHRRICERVLDLLTCADIKYPDELSRQLDRWPYDYGLPHDALFKRSKPRLIELDDESNLELLAIGVRGRGGTDGYVLLSLFRRDFDSTSGSLIDTLEFPADMDVCREFKFHDFDSDGVVDAQIVTSRMCYVPVWEQSVAITAAGFEDRGRTKR